MPAAEPLPRLVAAESLTREAFLPYGELVTPGAQAGMSINAGSAQRFDAPGGIDVDDSAGAACLTIFRTLDAPSTGPIRLRAFERHLLGSQTFVPLAGGRCLCVVTGGEHAPDEAAVRAFFVEPGQGITLRRGVWHHPLITLGPADVLVIERRAAQVDCELQQIAGSILVVLDDAAGPGKGSNDEHR